MRPEHLAGSPVELLEGAETTPCSNGVLQHPPEAFDRVEVMATMGWQEMQAQLAVVVLEGRVELVRSMNPAAIHDHDNLFLGVPEGRHHLMEILAQFLGIKMRHDFIEDFRGPILDGPDDAEQHAAGDAAPRAILHPRLAFETFFTLDLTLTQGASEEARTLRCMPPARAGQSKTPQDGFVFIEQNDLATASTVLQSRQFDRAISEVCGVGIEATSGTIVAYVLFFKTPRTLSRPSWTPVCCASTVASSRQLHWE